jgi:signal transduction histidine kinase
MMRITLPICRYSSPRVTLAKFILENMEDILTQWDEFARTLSSSSGLGQDAVRNHAERMLRTVAAEMMSSQSDEQQLAKSRGTAPSAAFHPATAAQTHGDQRYAEGFDLKELVSEYRALRATVIRLWTRGTPLDERTIDELIRFNEGLDQLLTESVLCFSKQLDRARELFMGVLGHDLRTDLQVILSCSERLESAPSKEQIQKYVPHVRESTLHIQAMAEDLLDVARTRLGGQMPIERTHVDAAVLCEEVLHPFQQLHPSGDIRLQIDGDVTGKWDPKRLQQMLANLVRNAFQHGDSTRPITLSARGADENVEFKVHNHGRPIPRSVIAHIFDPMEQGGKHEDRTSLGLGLYIACTIARAHRGTLTVSSSEAAGTIFTATLPRQDRTKLLTDSASAKEKR